MGWVQEHLSCAGEDLNHCEHSLLSPGFIFFLCFILLVPAFFFKVFYSDLAKERLFWKADTICCMFIAQCFIIYMDKYPSLKKWGRILSRIFVLRHWQYWLDDDTGIAKHEVVFHISGIQWLFKMLGHGPMWQKSCGGEKLLHNIKSHLLFKCENYLHYITKILQLEKEAPIYK